MAADGTWSAPVRLPDAGTYRVSADVTRDGEAQTLAGDLRVDGDAALEPLPAPAAVARADGYRGALDPATLRAGREAELEFSITRGGEPVDVEGRVHTAAFTREATP